jgi:hypothetical protein
MLKCRPVALVTAAVMYGFASFQSSVAMKITAAVTTMQKTEPIQIKARRSRLVMKHLLTDAPPSCYIFFLRFLELRKSHAQLTI